MLKYLSRPGSHRLKVNRAGSAFARPFAARPLDPQPSRRNSHWDSGERAKSSRSNARRGWLLRSSGMDLAIVRARDAVGAEYFCSIFYVRFRGTPESAFTAMRAILRNADPALPATFRTLDEQIGRSLNTERMLAALSTGFGALALMLSLVGLYGVMSFVVTQRTRELGIRLALGASRLSTIWLVLRDALVMIAGGTAIALPCVWALGRLVESQLYDVKPTDPVTLSRRRPSLPGSSGSGWASYRCSIRPSGSGPGRLRREPEEWLEGS